MSCPKCSRSVPGEATFCPWCGASLTPVACPYCGTRAPEGAQFCLSCGKPLASKPAAAPTPVPPPVDRDSPVFAAAPPQVSVPVMSAASPQDSGYRPLTGPEVEALKRAASWEIQLAQVAGFVSIIWGVIGYFAPIENLFVFSMIGLVPGLFALFGGLAARQKMMTANQAIANGRAVEFVGSTRADAKNLRRIDFNGGYLTFAAQRISKDLNEATKSSGAQLRVTFTEGGTETKAGTETMILAVNGSALTKPVLGTVGVAQ